MNTTVIIAIITALSSIISSIVATGLSNFHQRKLKRIDLEQERYNEKVLHIRNIFEAYLRDAGHSVTLPDNEPIGAYGESYLLALMYSPPKLHDKMIELNRLLSKDYDWDKAKALLEELIPEIKLIIQEQKS